MKKGIKCKQAEKMFDGYLSGKLHERLKTELEQHISCCDDCRRQIRAYNVIDQTVEALHLLPQDRNNEKKIPSHLKAKIFANIEAINSGPQPFKLRVCLRPLCIAAAAAMILLIPIGIIRKSHKETVKSYNSNSFIADAIAQARAMNDTEQITAKTSDIIGIVK